MRPIALLAALLVVLAGCDRKPEVMRLAGETMGTTYHVTVVDAPPDIDEAAVGAAITSTLEEVNAEMSTWDPTSEVSRLNAHASTDPVPISADLADVLRLLTVHLGATDAVARDEIESFPGRIAALARRGRRGECGQRERGRTRLDQRLDR